MIIIIFVVLLILGSMLPFISFGNNKSSGGGMGCCEIDEAIYEHLDDHSTEKSKKRR